MTVNLFRPRFLLAGGLVAAMVALTGLAQQMPQGPDLPQPRLLIVSPAGGQGGGTGEIVLTGTDLDDATGLLFSHPGIKAELQGTSEAPTTDTKTKGRKQAQGALQSVRYRVTLPKDIPPGMIDIRLVGKHGVSNPRTFVVGDLPERQEKEPNNDIAEAQEIPLNSTAYGTISQPTDVDFFRFRGNKGQRVVFSCLASSLDSRLHAALEIYSATGQLLGSGRNSQGTDALTDVTLPSDGEYLVRVYSFAYLQGGPEHFYRLTVSTAPWIDAIFPPMVEPGKPSRVTVYGRNLPQGVPDPEAVVQGRILEKVDITLQPPTDPQVGLQPLFRGHVPPVSAALDSFEHRIRNAQGVSNPYLVARAEAPVVLDMGKNDTPESAQSVSVPCEIAGRIEKRRDRDWYRFDARKGEILSLELYGDRLGSPLDLYARLRNARTQATIADLDDNPETPSNQFFTRSEDPPRYRFTVPETGTYLLQVGSREADVEASPRHLYRVRLTQERPDFHLVVMPASPNSPEATLVRRGSAQYFSVFVTRWDGFDGEIGLRAEGLPEGVTCTPQTIGVGQRQGVLVLRAAEGAPLKATVIRVVGKASIQGKTVEHEARPATITWPLPQGQNGPVVSRLDRSLVLGVGEAGPFSLSSSLTEIQTRPGQKVAIPLKLKRHWPDFKGQVQVIALGIPQGQNPQPQNLPADKEEMVFQLDVRANTPPGIYTVVLRGQAQIASVKEGAAKGKQNLVVAVPSTPITLKVEATGSGGKSRTP